MTRLLLDRSTNQLLPYPRQDDEPVAGLDRTAAYVVEVVREPELYFCKVCYTVQAPRRLPALCLSRPTIPPSASPVYTPTTTLRPPCGTV
jgi:hypothetical protein